MNDDAQFRADGAREISAMGGDAELRHLTRRWMDQANQRRYSYHFTWMGVPIIQYPQDILAMQEIVWSMRPEVIVETGVARGGSLVFYASMLELLGCGEVIGIDIDIRPHNRAAIEGHPMARRIRLVQGSSIDHAIVEAVHQMVGGRRALVVLDSNHTHAHVLAELFAYASLVPVGGHLVVMDTVIEDMPTDSFPDRPWGPGNNPKTAVQEFLASHPNFTTEVDIHNKLLITVAPGGYLRRTS